MFDFEAFPKIARLKREQIITEKLDGTNAQVCIFELETDEQHEAAFNDQYCINVWHGAENGDSPIAMYAGSRKRWITPEGVVENIDGTIKKGTDNFAFAAWVRDNSNDLRKLGPGQHFGEWYGNGIQRGYRLAEKRFALFNVARWGDHNPNTPDCVEVVKNLTPMCKGDPDLAMDILNEEGSYSVPGFMNPEGIVIFHTASRTLYKQTFEQDGGKWNS